KFFLHWYWRNHALLGRCDALLGAGALDDARAAAARFEASALATGEPNLHALAFDAGARVALADGDRDRAAAMVARGLAVVAGFAVPTVAWRVHATAGATGEARAVIQGLAESLAPDAGLRRSFLSAVREIL